MVPDTSLTPKGTPDLSSFTDWSLNKSLYFRNKKQKEWEDSGIQCPVYAYCHTSQTVQNGAHAVLLKGPCVLR